MVVEGLSKRERKKKKKEKPHVAFSCCQKQNISEEHNWSPGQHEVGRKIGHITGIALGIVRLCPT